MSARTTRSRHDEARRSSTRCITRRERIQYLTSRSLVSPLVRPLAPAGYFLGFVNSCCLLCLYTACLSGVYLYHKAAAVRARPNLSTHRPLSSPVFPLSISTTDHQAPTTYHRPLADHHQPPASRHRPPAITGQLPPPAGHLLPSTAHHPPPAIHQPYANGRVDRRPHPHPHP